MMKLKPLKKGVVGQWFLMIMRHVTGLDSQSKQVAWQIAMIQASVSEEKRAELEHKNELQILFGLCLLMSKWATGRGLSTNQLYTSMERCVQFKWHVSRNSIPKFHHVLFQKLTWTPQSCGLKDKFLYKLPVFEVSCSRSLCICCSIIFSVPKMEKILKRFSV